MLFDFKDTFTYYRAVRDGFGKTTQLILLGEFLGQKRDEKKILIDQTKKETLSSSVIITQGDVSISLDECYVLEGVPDSSFDPDDPDMTLLHRVLSQKTIRSLEGSSSITWIYV